MAREMCTDAVVEVAELEGDQLASPGAAVGGEPDEE
jgi:hypothetical protein